MDPELQVSRTASDHLTEFSNEFAEALLLGDVVEWAKSLGLVRTTRALSTRFPFPLDAAGYKELKGDLKYRTLYGREMTMKGKVWQDGIKEFARNLETDAFTGWNEAPAAMAQEWLRLVNVKVAEMLALSSYNGPLLSLYDNPDTDTKGTRRLFANDHPYNLLDASVGTFTNYTTTTRAAIADGTFFDSVYTYFRSLKGPNGQKLGMRFGGGSMIVPGSEESLFKTVLTDDTLIRSVKNGSTVVGGVGMPNRYKTELSFEVGEELADGYFYCFPAAKPGMKPWAIQTTGEPTEIRQDLDSHLYKTSLEVAIAYVGEMNCAAMFPHAIYRVQITG
jgi:hypothetical protein